MFADNTKALAFNAANGVAFQLPTSGSGQFTYFYITDDNVIIFGLQFQDPLSTSIATIIGGSKNIAVIGNIIDGYSQPASSIIQGNLLGSSTALFQLISNLIIDRTPAASICITAKIDYNISLSCNTFISTTASANAVCVLAKGPSGATGRAVDNIFIGYVAGFTVGSDTGTTWDVSYCLSTAATISGTGVTLGSGNLFSKTAAAQFVSATTNFRVLPNADATNAGTTDTTGNPLQTDILGRSRPQGIAWDMGANEYPQTPTVGTAVGGALVSGVAVSRANTVGTAVGGSVVMGVSPALGVTAGHAVGGAVVSGVATATAFTVGTAVGGAIVNGVPDFFSILTDIHIDAIPPQLVEQPFQVSGTYTLIPQLQFTDDGGTTYGEVDNVQPLGNQRFTFTHKGMPKGKHELAVQDVSTGGAAAANYIVDLVGTKGTVIPTFPPSGPTTLQNIIPSYLYQEYADDDDLQAFVASQNIMAQSILTWFTNISLPIYTQPQIQGLLLDWVAEGLYGLKRPIIAYASGSASGTFNTWMFNTIPINTGVVNAQSQVFNVSDDIFKRIITWHFYKGDGFQFTVPWLKRRIMRFLGGTNGVDYGVDQTYQVSVVPGDNKTFNISITGGPVSTVSAGIMRAGILSGVLSLPFQYNYAVVI